MDVKNLVKKILDIEEDCTCCVEGTTEVNGQKCQRFVCLITRKGDYAVCILSSLRTPCLHSDDLRIEVVLPVDENLSTKLEPAKNDKPDSKKTFVLGINSKDQGYKFELSEGETIQQLLAELKHARDLLSQNACFGLPSTFRWLEKYQKKNKHKSENPFEKDIFDPLAYMGIDVTQSQLASAKQSHSSFIDEISYTFGDDLTGMRNRSSSKDSLDALDSNELTQSKDTAQRNHPHIGITAEAQLASEERSSLRYREKLLKYYMDKRETEFTRATNFRVFCGTWNVNGQSPPLAVESLKKWLSVDKDPPDIYVIGFQELDLSSQALIFTESAKEDEWQRAVPPCLHQKARYRKVKSIRLVGVLLLVYIKTEHVNSVSLIDSDSVPTGILGLMGNKGGVGVRFSIQNTSLCFISSHLAAHQEEIERRNQDYKDIETKMRFKQFFPPLTIADHDVIFWIGDLNYRIDMDINVVNAYIKEEQYKPLLSKDQLLKQLGKEHKDVFRGYKEGPITFPPSYKFDPNTDNYDTSEKNRIPAWCDRILWKGKGIKQLAYRSHHVLKISDHKPVSSIFDVEIRVIDPDKYKKVYEDIMRKLDREENDYLPQVSLGYREFVFKDVKFIEPQEKILPIANIGQVPVNFEFINKLDEKRYGKPWLSVNPSTQFITPGDSLEVSVEIYVDKKTVGKLNSGEDKLDDILVLHLHGGKDFFYIPVSGNFIPSSFGSSVEALVQMHGPIREVPTEKLIDLEHPGSLSKVDTLKPGTKLYACPKEIWRLVDHIYKYGRHQANLFQQPGLESEIQQIRDCLDTGVPEIIPGCVHSVAEALLLFLECLPEPVVPYILYNKCLECSNSFLLCKQVLQQAPECHRNVFKYICALLRELLTHSEHNSLEVKFLASIFGDVLLRAPDSEKQIPLSMKARRASIKSEEVKKAAFVYHFITNEYDD